MSRYIDADAMDKRRIDYIVDGYADSADDMAEWGMAIIEAPSIDIVRCKECMHYRRYIGTDYCLCDRREGSVKDDDYCSHGERADGKERVDERMLCKL